MADARYVSNHLVDAAKAQNRTLNPMQVLKLVYISHGVSLGAQGVPLIPNRIEAWKFGPVIPDLYHSIKHWRNNPVEYININGLEDFVDGQRQIVDIVYDVYKHLDGIQLSSLTHRRGTPWHQVYHPSPINIIIPNDIIQRHYSEMLA